MTPASRAFRSSPLIALLVFVFGAGVGRAEDLPSVELPAPLTRVLTDYEAAWHAKDATALSRLFAEDGFVLSSGTPPVRGRAAIEKHYQGHGGPLSLRALAFATDGSIGYIIGAYTTQSPHLSLER